MLLEPVKQTGRYQRREADGKAGVDGTEDDRRAWPEVSRLDKEGLVIGSCFVPCHVWGTLIHKAAVHWELAAISESYLCLKVLELGGKLIILESLRLEKTARFIYFNHQIITAMHANLCASVPHILFSSWKCCSLCDNQNERGRSSGTAKFTRELCLRCLVLWLIKVLNTVGGGYALEGGMQEKVRLYAVGL